VAWKHDEVRAPNEVKCYDALTGALRWTQAIDSKLIHTPQIGQAYVYVASEKGTLYAFNQADGKLLWKASIGTPLTLPAADRTLVLVGNGNALVGLKALDGTRVFTADLGGAVTSVPVVAEEGGYASVNDAIVAVDRAGKERWRVQVKSPVWASLAVTKSGVLCGSVDGAVRLLAREDGKVKWESLLAGTPNVLAGAGDVVYAGTRQGTLVGLKLSDGSKLWAASLGAGPVDGVALSAGKLVAVAGKWVGALLPAPEAPENVSVKRTGGRADLAWDAAVANGSPVSAYRIFRRRGASSGQVAVVNGGNSKYAEDVLDGEMGYAVSAIAVNGAESVRSVEVSTGKGEPLLRKLSVVPMPYDPRTGALAVTFTLREGARVRWEFVDAEGKAVTDEHVAVLPRGEATITWYGTDRVGKTVEPGVYQARVRAEGENETEALARAFPVAWGYQAAGSALAGVGNTSLHGSAGAAASVGTVEAASAGIGFSASAASAGGGAASGAGSSVSGGGVAAGGGSVAVGGGSASAGGSVATGGGSSSAGTGNNGVRDHGVGEGRDNSGQGKGQGSSHGKK
jgi:outer membrane protein assembly factor BamB